MESDSPHSAPEETSLRSSEMFFNTFFTEQNCDAYGWGPLQTYPPYTEIIKQDEPSRAAYFIHEGVVKLTWIDQHGHEVIAGIRYKDWIIGAPSVLLERPYSFTVTTLTKNVLRCISAKNFLCLAKTHTEFVLHLLRILCCEFFNQGKKLVMFGCAPGRERLKYLLFKFIKDGYKPGKLQKQMRIHLPLKHKELAQIIAVSPEHLSRLLKELEVQKVIRREKDSIILLDPSIIQQWAVL